MKKLIFILLLVTACKEVAQLPSPTPGPSATACQCPSATPTANPGFVCQLPDMPNCAENNTNCCKEGGSGKYKLMIQKAQAELLLVKPRLFKPDGSIAVSDLEYTTELAKMFQDLNQICAVGGGVEPLSHDEIGIKETNGQATHVDVVIGDTRKPWTGGEYTCAPSAF